MRCLRPSRAAMRRADQAQAARKAERSLQCGAEELNSKSQAYVNRDDLHRFRVSALFPSQSLFRVFQRGVMVLRCGVMRLLCL